MAIAAQIPIRQTINVDHNGQQVTVGLFRRSTQRERLTVFDAHKEVKALNTENGTNVRIVRPAVADIAVTTPENYRILSHYSRFFTDVFIAYKKPRTKLDAEVVFTFENEPRVTLSVPSQYQGEMDIALVVTNVTFDDIQKDGKDFRLEVSESRILVVEAFPAKGGAYLPDSITTIPHGKKVKYSAEARRLWRVLDYSYMGDSYVGPVVRGVDFYGNGSRYVAVGYRPSTLFGVVVEVPQEDFAKLATKNESRLIVPGVSIKELGSLLQNAKDEIEQLAGIVEEGAIASLTKLTEVLGKSK